MAHYNLVSLSSSQRPEALAPYKDTSAAHLAQILHPTSQSFFPDTLAFILSQLCQGDAPSVL